MSALKLSVAPIQAETVLIGVGVIAGLFLLYKAVNSAADVAEAVNPFNNDNIINQGFTNAYQYFTGSTGSLGTDIYDFTHDAVDPATGKVTKAPIKAVNGGLQYASYASNPVLGLVKATQYVVTTEYDWLQKKLKQLF